ncbi:acyl carrier protein [Mesorhizobium sp. B2-3-4]|uniref:acyl carrier protein n=1 Tax=Mesorhizobium sp. B2-3-4 TaxID=2589959 RepID=UPI0011263698|nr:acyl carrier protein [Mesorhizobium sp. B2-3-4]TPM36096.1 acyl carrier protein [Mesorhizobium sp. B2-3-4]
MDNMTDVSSAAVQDWILEQARKILKSEDVGPQDYFLDLGGDSLMAPLLANRIEAEYGVRPELEDIFTRPFGELADLVRAGMRR